MKGKGDNQGAPWREQGAINKHGEGDKGQSMNMMKEYSEGDKGQLISMVKGQRANQWAWWRNKGQSESIVKGTCIGQSSSNQQAPWEEQGQSVSMGKVQGPSMSMVKGQGAINEHDEVTRGYHWVPWRSNWQSMNMVKGLGIINGHSEWGKEESMGAMKWMKDSDVAWLS